MKALDPLAVSLRGTNLIEASAGTGKTHAITTLYLRLLLEGQYGVRDILVVTFTNAATAELRLRIRRRLRDALAAMEGPGPSRDEILDRLVQQRRADGTLETGRRLLALALQDFDEAAIFTIHGFCQRMLQDNAFESGAAFDTELVTDETGLREEVLCDFWARELHAAPEIFVRHTQQKKAVLDTLRGLAQSTVKHFDAPIVPARRAIDLGSPAVAKRMRAWQAAHAGAAALWTAHRAEIVEVLCGSASLNRSKYKADSIRNTWAPRMDSELAAPVPDVCSRFKEFAKFTTAGLAAGTKKGGAPPEHAFFEACDALAAADDAVARDLDERVLQLRLDLASYARAEMRRRKQASHTQSYDDLLCRLREALDGAGGADLAAAIRTRYPAVLIDEFQDTDPVQYDIFRRVYRDSGGVLFLIGDPKQAIYAFRGADVFAYIAAKADAGANAYSLGTNWRSGPALVRAVNTVFGRARAQFVLDEIGFEPARAAPRATDALGGALGGRAPLRFLFVRRQPGATCVAKGWGKDQLPGLIAAEIVRLLTSEATIDGGAVEPGDIAVLCRTNDQARAVQERLRPLHVPSVLQSEDSVFDTAEAGDLERVLGALADPGDTRALRAALSTAVMGLSAEDLEALGRSDRDWDAWVERFQGWHAVWLQQGFMAAFRRLLDEYSVQPHLLGLEDGERRLTNVLHLGELLQSAGAEARRGPLALVEWLRRMRRDTAARGEVGSDAAQVRLESDARAVKLVTIHKSKGLEYPVVFCPFLWDGALLRDADKECLRFHDPDAGNRLTLDLGSPKPDRDRHEALATREARAENLRLLYVALTRAKRYCSVVWGRFNEAESSPLAYVLHQPESVAAGADLAAATRDRFKALDDDAIRAELDALAAASGGAIEIAELSRAAVAAWEPGGAAAPELNCRAAERALDAHWRASSFSALVAAAERLSLPAEEGVDHDAAVEAAEPAAAAAPVTLHDFPAGAQSGQLIHEIFQHLDFEERDLEALRAAVRERLAAYGVEARWLAPLCRAIGEVLDTPLDGAPEGLALRRIPALRRLNEMEFTFPVARRAADRGAGAGGGVSGLLTPARLAGVFARHGAPSSRPNYAERIRHIGFAPLAGYLRGFIDLAFEHEGRWYVADYKSNRLGTTADDYRPERLAEAMAHGDYYLQYHLYAVALHRYLAQRVPAYDYDRHFGGVYYLFVRGMAPGHGAGCGVFADHPSRALIEDLSAVLGGAGGTR